MLTDSMKVNAHMKTYGEMKAHTHMDRHTYIVDKSVEKVDINDDAMKTAEGDEEEELQEGSVV